MKKILVYLLSASAALAFLTLSPLTMAEDEQKMIEKGKKLALSRKGGNCLACHQFEGAEQAGNMGPPLVAMKSRFPDKAKLRARIWDATASNPTSQMPPFGKNLILSEEEIDQVVAFISTL